MAAGQAAVGHGKIILLGEHGVVHGRPALAAGLARGCTATAVPAAADRLTVLPWGVTVDSEPERDDEHATLRAAFRAVLASGWDGGVDRAGHFHVTARLEIPAGAGLGASAALSVAVVRALDAAAGASRDDAAVGASRDDAAVVEASLAWERQFHGNPSGVDSAMAVYGGVALYLRGQPLHSVSIGCPLWLVVGHSGQAPSTADMVASVARQHGRAPAKVDKIFDGMEAVVNNGRSALAEGNLRDLGQLMELNQKLLNSLMLSTTAIEEMCGCARDAGALGAKLTGGGGGGCMIALADSRKRADAVAYALRTFDPEAFVVELGQ